MVIQKIVSNLNRSRTTRAVPAISARIVGFVDPFRSPSKSGTSNIKIDNLSYDMNMDRDAMEAIAGAWGWSSAKRSAKRKYQKVRRSVRRVRLKVEHFFHRNGLYFNASHSGKF